MEPVYAPLNSFVVWQKDFGLSDLNVCILIVRYAVIIIQRASEVSDLTLARVMTHPNS